MAADFFRSLADIEALERTPYEQAIPARTPYGLIARAAQRFPGRTAFTYLPDGDPATPPQRMPEPMPLCPVWKMVGILCALITS